MPRDEGLIIGGEPEGRDTLGPSPIACDADGAEVWQHGRAVAQCRRAKKSDLRCDAFSQNRGTEYIPAAKRGVAAEFFTREAGGGEHRALPDKDRLWGR